MLTMTVRGTHLIYISNTNNFYIDVMFLIVPIPAA